LIVTDRDAVIGRKHLRFVARLLMRLATVANDCPNMIFWHGIASLNGGIAALQRGDRAADCVATTFSD